jgi:hypothetical protein
MPPRRSGRGSRRPRTRPRRTGSPSSWTFFLDPSETSVNEDLEVETNAIVDLTIRELINDIEADEGRPLDEFESAMVQDLVRSSVATPLLLEDEDEDADDQAGIDDQMAG